MFPIPLFHANSWSTHVQSERASNQIHQQRLPTISLVYSLTLEPVTMSGNMATWDQQIKFEESPAESFISTPGDSYPSLFESQSQTLDPSDMMTPPNGPDDEGLALDVEDEDDTPTSDSKKPTKKRKSWGQVLPEPKTNLPPRYVYTRHIDYRTRRLHAL